VAKIVGEVNYQPGALPLLQYALTELFEQRQGRLLTHEAYQAIGGTVGALAKRAEELYGGLDEQGREIARQMFLRLVTWAGLRIPGGFSRSGFSPSRAVRCDGRIDTLRLPSSLAGRPTAPDG
jgi:hypothetical protein